jgi:hypothetical protein
MSTTIRIEFETNWQPRKLAMMKQHFVSLMAVNGAPNIRWEVIGEKEEKPKFLHIGCSICAAAFGKAGKPYRGWISAQFSPCHMHGREGMVKMQEQRIEMPKGMSLGQPVERHASIVASVEQPQQQSEEEEDATINDMLKDRGFGEEGHLTVEPAPRLGG